MEALRTLFDTQMPKRSLNFSQCYFCRPLCLYLCWPVVGQCATAQSDTHDDPTHACDFILPPSLISFSGIPVCLSCCLLKHPHYCRIHSGLSPAPPVTPPANAPTILPVKDVYAARTVDFPAELRGSLKPSRCCPTFGLNGR